MDLNIAFISEDNHCWVFTSDTFATIGSLNIKTCLFSCVGIAVFVVDLTEDHPVSEISLAELDDA